MEKRKRLQRGINCAFAALFAAALFSALFAMPLCVSANSALYVWEGSAAGGVAVVGEECPVAVEHETLVFTIEDLPTDYGDRNMEAYEAHVTAEYTFYNPAAYDAAMTLVFPYGTLPEYVPAGFSPLSRCSVTADGAAVHTKQRRTYNASGAFDVASGLAQLAGTSDENAFFTPDLPVTVYAYKISGDTGGNFSARITLADADTSATRIFVSGARYYAGGADYAAELTVQNGDIVWVAVAGADTDIVWEVLSETGMSGGAVQQFFSQQTDFEQLALWFYAGGEENTAYRTDWYNAVLAALEEESENIPYSFSVLDVQNRLLYWLEYDLTIPAGGRVKNTVTVPLYPEIYRVSDSRTPWYEYTYLLSPAKTWAAFGTLSVEVRTPFEMRSADYAFDRTDEGYALSLEALPEGELFFSLRAVNAEEALFDKIAWAALIALGVAAVAAAIGLTIWAVVRRKKRAARQGKGDPQ